MPVGAVVGAVVGAAKTPPPEQVRLAQTALVDAVTAAELPRTIRDETIRLGSERTGHTFVPITSQGPEAAGHEVGTVLEILIRHVGLERRATQSTTPGDVWLDTDPEFELRLDVDARLVRASDGTVLYADLFQEIAPSRQFSVWVADDGRVLRDDLRWIAGLLADQVTMVILLSSQIQQRGGHPLPSGSFAYARAAYERGNYATALWLFGRLAEQGNADAQYNLGLMYNTGQGVPQDYVQAYMWLTLAAARFPASQAEWRGKAIRDRDEVAPKMTPEQIDEAQRLAQEWKPE
jgi:hypothetical protein